MFSVFWMVRINISVKEDMPSLLHNNTALLYVFMCLRAVMAQIKRQIPQRDSKQTEQMLIYVVRMPHGTRPWGNSRGDSALQYVVMLIT